MHHKQNNYRGGTRNWRWTLSKGTEVALRVLALHRPDEPFKFWMFRDEGTKDAVLFIQGALKLGRVQVNLPSSRLGKEMI